jgi:nucleotide-binding universal stress UspA family protein
MLRSALVALDGSEYSEPATTLAIDWGLRFGARLLGLGVLDEAGIQKGEMVPMGAGAYKKARDEARMADAHRRIEAFLGEFKGRAAAAGVSAQVLEEIGDPADRIHQEAHRADVVILARETQFHAEAHERADETLAEILRGSPRPIVVVPRELWKRQGVVVAYGGGREAARTLQTFVLLGLADGEEIEVLTVHRDGAAAEATAHLAGDFLSAHGVRHQLHPIASQAAPATVILEHVGYRGPQLLVMGAHGHHPLRDLFASSVTRRVLTSCPVPVFVGA